MWLAEAKPFAAPPLCPTTFRNIASGAMVLPLCSSALQYSTPRISFGSRSTASSSPMSALAALSLAAAKNRPLASSSRSASGKSARSSAFAARCNFAALPHSLPKASVSTTPVAAKMLTPPRAKPSADEMAHGSGSSRTKSAPPRTAASARACARSMAKSPRWTKSPLIAHTTAHSSSPARRRNSSICHLWPRWKGLYSHIIPNTLMEVLSKRLQKSYVLLNLLVFAKKVVIIYSVLNCTSDQFDSYFIGNSGAMQAPSEKGVYL